MSEGIRVDRPKGDSRGVSRAILPFFRCLKELPAARGLRTFLFSRILRREQRYVSGLSARAGSLPDVVKALEGLFGEHGEKVFFILGNGDSINRLSADAFGVIRQNVSVGLNAWPLHDFRPNIYSFEFGNDSKPQDQQLSWLVDRARTVSDDVKPLLLFLRPSPPKYARISKWLDSLSSSTVAFHGRANLSTSQKPNLEEDVSSALRELSKRGAGLVALDNGASAVRLISLALLAGVKRIVLSGIDLNGSDYFWYSEEFISRSGDFTASFPRSLSDSTSTLSDEDRPFSTLDFIVALARVAENEYSAEIFVASAEQALSGHLSVFDFDSVAD